MPFTTRTRGGVKSADRAHASSLERRTTCVIRASQHPSTHANCHHGRQRVPARCVDARRCSGQPTRTRIERRCASDSGIIQSRHSRRIVPMTRSQIAFALGLENGEPAPRGLSLGSNRPAAARRCYPGHESGTSAAERGVIRRVACAPQKCRPAGAIPDFSTSAFSVIRFSGPYSIRERRRRLDGVLVVQAAQHGFRAHERTRCP